MKELPNIDIFNRMKAELDKRGMSFYEFGEKYGHNDSLFSTWKRRGISKKALSTTNVILDLCRATGKTPDYFLKNSDTPVSADVKDLIDEIKTLKEDIKQKDKTISIIKAERDLEKAKNK